MSESLATWAAVPGNLSTTGFLPANVSAVVAAVDAFCRLIWLDGEDENRFDIYGGGHGDGTFNGVIEGNINDLGFTELIPGTPGSAYPPLYQLYYGGTGPGDINVGAPKYPSGLQGWGKFLTAASLSDPADLPYAAPFEARMSSHTYFLACYRAADDKVHFFYYGHGTYDRRTGVWDADRYLLGPQLYALGLAQGTNLNSQELTEGASATYDEVTDRFYIVLSPGANTNYTRSGVVVFNPNLRVLETLHLTSGGNGVVDGDYGWTNDEHVTVRVGRDLYIFTRQLDYADTRYAGYGPTSVVNQGMVFNMDTRNFKRFQLIGDTAESLVTQGPQCLTIPACYTGASILRVNYGSTAHRSKVLRVNLTPEGGVGTMADPLLLRQTATTVTGMPTTNVIQYDRLRYHKAAGALMLLPTGYTKWHAIPVAA